MGVKSIIYELYNVEQVILPTVLVFFCYVTNDHKLWGLKQPTQLENSQFCRTEVCGLDWVLCLIKAKIMMLAGLWS